MIADEALVSGARDLDGARLEHVLESTDHEVSYVHDPVEAARHAMEGQAAAAVLIRPVAISEITRTGRTGEVMPPKSTFVEPKLRSGITIFELEP